MGTNSSLESRFRERIRDERKARGWSQAQLSKILQRSGLEGMLPSTVAKIEAGDRSVRIDEAAVMADVFEVPVDALLGRGRQRDVSYILRMLTDTARQSTNQLDGLANTLGQWLDDAKMLQFENRDNLVHDCQRALDKLDDAKMALGLVGAFNVPQDIERREPDTWLSEITEQGRRAGREMDIATRAYLHSGADESEDR